VPACTAKRAAGPHATLPPHSVPSLPAQVADPVRSCVSAVYVMLVAAARDAAAAAGANTEAALSGKAPLAVPDFASFIMPPAVKALDEWRAEAETSEGPVPRAPRRRRLPPAARGQRPADGARHRPAPTDQHRPFPRQRQPRARRPHTPPPQWR
jgi:hypothetical protein